MLLVWNGSLLPTILPQLVLTLAISLVSLIGNAWNDRTILHHVRLIEQASVTNPVFTQQLDTTRSLLHLSPDSTLAFFNASVDPQAAVMGLNDIFYVSAIIFVAIIPLIWITKPARSGGGDADAAAAGAH